MNNYRGLINAASDILFERKINEFSDSDTDNQKFSKKAKPLLKKAIQDLSTLKKNFSSRKWIPSNDDLNFMDDYIRGTLDEIIPRIGVKGVKLGDIPYFTNPNATKGKAIEDILNKIAEGISNAGGPLVNDNWKTDKEDDALFAKVAKEFSDIIKILPKLEK